MHPLMCLLLTGCARLDPAQTTPAQEIEETDPKKNAAKLGMYGHLTHDVQPWYPHKLLCKRFGVRDPHPDGPPTAAAKSWEEELGVKTAAPPVPEVDLADVEMRPLDSVGVGGAGETEEENLGPRDLANVGLGEDPRQGMDTLTYVRPAMDVFKAIFASDDEDSEDEDEGGEGTNGVKEAEVKPLSTLDAALASVRPAMPTVAHTPDGEEGPVDPGTFKPVFNLRTKGKDKDKDKKSKDKKDKKSKGKRAALSFDVDEGADEEGPPEPKKRRERDKVTKKPRTLEKDEEGGEWVEKPSPLPAAIGENTKLEPGSGAAAEGGGLSRTRKRAVDFM